MFLPHRRLGLGPRIQLECRRLPHAIRGCALTIATLAKETAGTLTRALERPVCSFSIDCAPITHELHLRLEGRLDAVAQLSDPMRRPF
jgi:hypothetical protein